MSAEVDRLEAGRELDAQVGKAFGFEPRVTWEVLNPEGTATAIGFDHEWQAREWLEKHLRELPNSRLKDYHVGPWEHWPRFSEDMGAAWRVAEKLEIGVLPWEEKGVKGFVAGFERDGASVSWFEAVLYEWPADASWAFAETAPLAICYAALRPALAAAVTRAGAEDGGK